MSSPNIKFQSLIRKFKNGIKETIDKKKIIQNFTYELKLDETLDHNMLFNSRNIEDYFYTIKNIENLADNLDEDIQLPKIRENIGIMDDDKSISYSPIDFNEQIQSTNFYDYIGDGYLKTVYNAELCDRNWIIFTYFINRIYPNFISNDKLKIKSLHINSTPGAELSAMHHFIYNSKINTIINNIEWNWIGTLEGGKKLIDPHNISKTLLYKYKNNILQLFNMPISSMDNLNFIINEASYKLSKINLICIDEILDQKNILAYGLLAIKILENNCIFYIKLPNIKDWDIKIINAILLYSLIFAELYVFNMDFGNKISTVLICKNKKKQTETIYKKIMYILSNDEFTNDYNIFSIEYLRSDNIKNWIGKLVNIILSHNNSLSSSKISLKNIIFNDVIYEISKILDINVNTFLY